MNILGQRKNHLSYGHSKGCCDIVSVGMSKDNKPNPKKSEFLQATLDLMVLKTLDALGPLHGYGIARRIEQVSEEVLQLNDGTVYTALLRLQQRSWVTANWGALENNRRANFMR
jgi:hypothetical protein